MSQLVQRFPEAGLNYERVPPRSASTNEPDQSSSDHEQKQAQSREEVWHNMTLHLIYKTSVARIKRSLSTVFISSRLLWTISCWIPCLRSSWPSEKTLSNLLKRLSKMLRKHTQTSFNPVLNLSLMKNFIDPVWQPDCTEPIILLNQSPYTLSLSMGLRQQNLLSRLDAD